MSILFRFFVWAVLLGIVAIPVLAEAPPETSTQTTTQWLTTKDKVALKVDDQILWQFNYAADQNVPCFHPITIGGQSLTWDQPADHPWHRGLWFCWKYINGVNFWEYDRATGKPSGQTKWSNVEIDTSDARRARIALNLTYADQHADQPWLTERRTLEISVSDDADRITIDWVSDFKAISDVTLDRTPPKPNSYGGYAGLSIRFAEGISGQQATSEQGGLAFNQGGRYRGNAQAVDYSFDLNDREAGFTVIDDPDNPRSPTKWYLIRSNVSNYLNAALLNDSPMELKSGDTLTLRYLVIAHEGRWDSSQLKDLAN